MPPITPDILLYIASHVDSQSTITSLMLTCKQSHSLILSYEKSIVKSWRGHTDNLSTGALLSSANLKAPIIVSPLTFAAMREIELRFSRVEALFHENGEIIKAIRGLGCFGGLDEGKLVGGLKMACGTADRLKDCLAEVRVNGEGGCEVCDARRAHWAMKRVIRAMERVDLAYLWVMERWVLPGTRAKCGMGLVAAQELFLRYGSVALEAWGLGVMAGGGGRCGCPGGKGDGHGRVVEGVTELGTGESLGRLFDGLMGEVLEEMRRFEEGGEVAKGETEEEDDGVGVLKGLHCTLWERAVEVFLGEEEREKVMGVDEVVLEVVRGDVERM